MFPYRRPSSEVLSWPAVVITSQKAPRSLVHGRIEGVEELVVRLVVCTDELP
jgi:hypothetical protein